MLALRLIPLAALLLIALAGCGGDRGDPKTAESASNPGLYATSYYDAGDDGGIAGGGAPSPPPDCSTQCWTR
jgi:hypothetical protein